MEPNEGVIVAVYPEPVVDVRMGSEFAYGPDVTGYPIIASCGPWGDRLLDIVTEPPSAVKWWKVVDYAREHGLDVIPQRWQGPVIEIPEKYFTADYILGIRLYNEGPWFWPKEPAMPPTESEPDSASAAPDLLSSDAPEPAGGRQQQLQEGGRDSQGANNAGGGSLGAGSGSSSLVSARTITGGGDNDTSSTLLRFLQRRKRL